LRQLPKEGHRLITQTLSAADGTANIFSFTAASDPNESRRFTNKKEVRDSCVRPPDFLRLPAVYYVRYEIQAAALPLLS